MKYERFEDLPVWQAAADVAAPMLVWTAQAWFRGKGDLANQLQRAALSISNNIAEGFELGTTKELLHFLYIARGSAGEVRSMLGVMEKTLEIEAKSASEISNFKSEISNLRSQISDSKSQVPDLARFKTEISNFKSACESISRQLRGWANSLQNSDIEGQRHLNDKSKQAFVQRQKRTVVQQRLDVANEELRRKLEASRFEREQTDEK